MGILESIAGQVMGGGGSQSQLITAVMGLIGNPKSGGIEGLVKQFAGQGLGDIVNSWISTGTNLPITPQQVEKGFGTKTITDLATTAGMAPGDVTSQLSKLLPDVVDKLTAGGKIPQGDIMSQGMGLLKGLMK